MDWPSGSPALAISGLSALMGAQLHEDIHGDQIGFVESLVPSQFAQKLWDSRLSLPDVGKAGASLFAGVWMNGQPACGTAGGRFVNGS